MVEAAVKTVLSLVLAGLAAAYACGWRRLCTAGHAPPLWRLALYALDSPRLRPRFCRPR